MSWIRPTLNEIVERASSDISTRITGKISALRRSVIRAIGAAIGGMGHLLYGFMVYIIRESFVGTAIDTFKEKASLWGVPRNAATFAEGFIIFEGVSTGAVLPALTKLQRTDGVYYTVQEDGEEDSGEISARVVCDSEGDQGNMDAGETLRLLSPIVGIPSSEGEVDTDGISGGSNEEDIEAWRERVLDRIQRPARGGNNDDYEFWAKEITGVTRVWVYPSQYGAGTVGVAFVRDGDGTGEDIFPSVGEVQDVQDHIDDVTELTADVTVWAPTQQLLPFNIHLSPDTAAIREAVTKEIEDLLLREAEPGGTILLSHIREAISSAAGEVDSTLVSPTTNQTADAGKLYQRGTITWS